VIESLNNFRARQFRQPAFDVTRSGRGIAGMDVAEVPLALDEITLVRQHHERIADRGIAVRMVLHRVTDDVGDLDEAPVVLLVQRPHDAPLHRLQPIREIRNRAVANDVTGVIQKAAIHPRVQAHAQLLGIKRFVGHGLDLLGDDVLFVGAVRVGRFLVPGQFARYDAGFSGGRSVGFAPSMGSSG
jgi:hypothetical protein